MVSFIRNVNPRAKERSDRRSHSLRGNHGHAVVLLLDNQQLAAADPGPEHLARLPRDDPIVPAVGDQRRYSDGREPLAEIEVLNIPQAAQQVLTVERFGPQQVSGNSFSLRGLLNTPGKRTCAASRACPGAARRSGHEPEVPDVSS